MNTTSTTNTKIFQMEGGAFTSITTTTSTTTKETSVKGQAFSVKFERETDTPVHDVSWETEKFFLPLERMGEKNSMTAVLNDGKIKFGIREEDDRFPFMEGKDQFRDWLETLEKVYE